MCKFPDVSTSLDWSPKWGLVLLQFRINVSEPICQSFMRISFLSFPPGTSPGFPRILLYPKPCSLCSCPATGVRTQMCPLEAGGPHTGPDLVPPGCGAEFCDSHCLIHETQRLSPGACLPHCCLQYQNASLPYIGCLGSVLVAVLARGGTEACCLEPGAPTHHEAFAQSFPSSSEESGGRVWPHNHLVSLRPGQFTSTTGPYLWPLHASGHMLQALSSCMSEAHQFPAWVKLICRVAAFLSFLHGFQETVSPGKIVWAWNSTKVQIAQSSTWFLY